MIAPATSAAADFFSSASVRLSSALGTASRQQRTTSVGERDVDSDSAVCIDAIFAG